MMDSTASDNPDFNILDRKASENFVTQKPLPSPKSDIKPIQDTLSDNPSLLSNQLAARHSPYQYLKNGKYLALSCLYLLGCVAIVVWMLASEPQPIPRQDTRITNAIISVLSRVALALALWIVAEVLRAQWAHLLISGRPVKLWALLWACEDMGSLLRLRYLHLMPTLGIIIAVIIGVGVTICMTLTSAGFKYVVVPGTAVMPFLGPDFPAICNYSMANATRRYFCQLAPNAVGFEWRNLDILNSRAGGNIVLTENTTTGWLSANVTLTSAPANIRLPSNPPPPWAAVDVSCRPAPLQLQSIGSGVNSTNNVVVDGRLLDRLDIATMPSWDPQVYLYQQLNDTGPTSSICPWYMLLLTRDVGDGSTHITGLARSALDYLGQAYIDLHGNGPMVQGVLGSAAYCNFSGSTGGSWPDIPWPIWPSTNVIVGQALENGMLSLGTVFLNYGPSWQFTPASDNFIPGGTISYVANFTTDISSYPLYIATYMRNQWALTMYTNNFLQPFVANTSYAVQTEGELHIQATEILLAPLVALVFCIGSAVAGIRSIARLGPWHGCVDIAPWWLMKAVHATPGLENREVNEKEFQHWAEQRHVRYEVSSRGIEGRGTLIFTNATSRPQPINRNRPRHHHHSQSPKTIQYLILVCLYLLSYIVIALWMFTIGPQPVPRQDTRITNTIISVLSRVALALGLWIVMEMLRAHWAHTLISGQLVSLRGFLSSCGETGGLHRLRHLRLMPTWKIIIAIIIGASVTVCMTFTSAGFKYIVMSSTAVMPFLGPDFQAICDYSSVNASVGYLCSRAANAQTVSAEWNGIDAVNSGAGGNVVLSGNTTTGWLSANVTLTSAPANIRLPSNPIPPWAAIDISCRPATLQFQSAGEGVNSSNNVTVDGRLLDRLSMANMPAWNDLLYLYPQVNDTGPSSSLCPLYAVILTRDVQDGTSHVFGLAESAVSSVGTTYLDLHGAGPIVAGILGAAAYCNFSGSTGGTWPDLSWPVWPTTNVVVGKGPENGTLGIDTVFLNYGPSWVFTPDSNNSIPGGVVSYIANFTTEASSFPLFVSTYIRNQWALMMYSTNFISSFVKNTSYSVQTAPQLHIQATAILAIPLTALVLCIGCAVEVLRMIRHLGPWHGRVDIAPWWLMKAINATPGLVDYEVNEKEFEEFTKEKDCHYEVNQNVNESGILIPDWSHGTGVTA